MTDNSAKSISSRLRLREVAAGDLPIFFEQQLDPVANHMAAFTAKDPADRAAFETHWARITADPAITIRTILFQGRVVGHIASFEDSGHLEVTYWLGQAYWGKGLATAALAAFLDIIDTRPLYARAVKDNIGSVRVLQKCGFMIVGQDKGFASARNEEVEEVILRLA